MHADQRNNNISLFIFIFPSEREREREREWQLNTHNGRLGNNKIINRKPINLTQNISKIENIIMDDGMCN